MELDRKELLKALDLTKPALGKNLYSGYHFNKNEIITFNDVMAIKYPFYSDITATVSKNPFYNFINKSSKDEVDLQLNDKTINVDNTANFPTKQMIDKLPMAGEVGKSKIDWYDLPDNFNEILKDVIPICSTDNSLPKLNYINIEDNVIESCDNISIIKYEIEKSLPDVLIRQDYAKKLKKFTLTRMVTDDNWMYFDTEEGALIMLRLTNVDYINIGKYFNEVKGNEIVLPDKLKNVLDKASLLACEGYKTKLLVEIDFGDDVTVYTDSEYGTFEENIDEDVGIRGRLWIDPERLLKVIDRDFKVVLDFDNGFMLFVDGDGNWKYLVLFIKPNEDEKLNG